MGVSTAVPNREMLGGRRSGWPIGRRGSKGKLFLHIKY